MPGYAAAVYDVIIGAEQFQKYDLVEKGCDWFRRNFPKQYRVLLDWCLKQLNGIPEAPPGASEVLEKKFKKIEKRINPQARKRVGPPVKNQGSSNLDSLQALG